jgi:E1-E2 ATPase
VASFAIAQVATGVVVLGLVTFNVVMGSSQELKARASVEALAQLQVPEAPVRRSGQVAEVESTELVPVDVVLVEAGGVVSADGRIVSSATLGVQEAALTGESAPIPRTGWPFPRSRSRSATGCIRSRAGLARTPSRGRRGSARRSASREPRRIRRASSTGSSSTATLLARPIAAGEVSPAHLAPKFDASLCRLPPSRRARQYQDSHADALGGVTRHTVVLRPRRHPWFVEVGAR